MNELERRYIELMIRSELTMNRREARAFINDATRLWEMIEKAKRD